MILKKIIDNLKENDQATISQLSDQIKENKEDISNAVKHLILLGKIKEVSEVPDDCKCSGCDKNSCSTSYYEKFYKLSKK